MHRQSGIINATGWSCRWAGSALYHPEHSLLSTANLSQTSGEVLKDWLGWATSSWPRLIEEERLVGQPQVRDHIISSYFVSNRNRFNLAPTSPKFYYDEPHSYVLIPKTIGNRKRDRAWGCARGINTTWENLQIEKHRSGRHAHRTDLCFSICRFPQVVLILRAQPHTQSFFYFQ